MNVERMIKNPKKRKKIMSSIYWNIEIEFRLDQNLRYIKRNIRGKYWMSAWKKTRSKNMVTIYGILKFNPKHGVTRTRYFLSRDSCMEKKIINEREKVKNKDLDELFS